MNHNFLVFLDYFLIIFHSLFTIFNIIGWIWRKTRKIHLITIAITAISWFVLGIWYGMGYCVCTDWHWQIRLKLGKPIMSNSYIQFLIKETTGVDINPNIIDSVVIVVFLVCVILSIGLFIRDITNKRAKQ